MNFNFLVNNTFSCDLAIDLGTAVTLIYMKDKGLVLKEPSMIAYDTFSGKIQATGSEAAKMLGKTPKSVTVMSPLSDGVISDFDKTCEMLKDFITRVYQKTILKPRVIMSVPSGSTEVEKLAFADVASSAGARETFLIEEPVAAASGAGCDISLARGMLIADLGAGKCDVASLSLGAAVVSNSITTAGDALTNQIIKYIRKNHNLNIGFVTAENIKKQIGCAYPREKTETMKVYGCDISTGLPRSIIINSEEIRDSLYPLLKKIAQVIITTLEDTPVELQSDISEDGMLITGGCANLYGIEKFLRIETGIKVFKTENPDECVVNGAGLELMKLDLYNSPDKKYYFKIYEK